MLMQECTLFGGLNGAFAFGAPLAFPFGASAVAGVGAFGASGMTVGASAVAG